MFKTILNLAVPILSVVSVHSRVLAVDKKDFCEGHLLGKPMPPLYQEKFYPTMNGLEDAYFQLKDIDYKLLRQVDLAPSSQFVIASSVLNGLRIWDANTGYYLGHIRSRIGSGFGFQERKRRHLVLYTVNGSNLYQTQFETRHLDKGTGAGSPEYVGEVINSYHDKRTFRAGPKVFQSEFKDVIYMKGFIIALTNKNQIELRSPQTLKLARPPRNNGLRRPISLGRLRRISKRAFQAITIYGGTRTYVTAQYEFQSDGSLREVAVK